MLKLTVKPLGAIGVECAAPVPLPSAAANKEWEKVAAGFLIDAFAERALWFIADDERATQWAYPETLTEQREILVDDTTYRLAFSERCPAETLTSLVGTSDFYWDAVWIAALRREDATRLDEIIRACTIGLFENLPRAEAEIWMPVGDGYGFWWINPRENRRATVGRLSSLTESVGWSLDAEGMDISTDVDN